MRIIVILVFFWGFASCGAQSESDLVAASIGSRSSQKMGFDNIALKRKLNSSSASTALKDYLKNTAQHCNSVELNILEVPVNYDNPSRGTWNFHYQMIRNGHSAAPVIIELPGGPGGGSIGNISSLNRMPGVNIIRIDPRGTQCNWGGPEDFREDEMTSKATAMDVAKLIQALGLKNYVLFGSSYGTVVATILSTQIQELGLPPPRSVVLQGTLGKSIGSFDLWYEAHFAQANALLRELDSEGLFQQEPLPLGYSPVQWASYLMNAGNDWISLEKELGKVLNALNNNRDVPAKILAKLEDEMKYNADSEHEVYTQETPEIAYTLITIMCRELANPLTAGLVYPSLGTHGLEAHRKPGAPDNLCSSSQFVDEYDSSQYQITAPIIYIQGERDPQTPLESSHYHYENQQNSANKIFLKIKNGPHAPLDASDHLENCTQDIFQAILNGRNPASFIDETLGRCRLTAGSSGVF